MSFLNRASELALLRERAASAEAEFLVVYGRRRVGKTELLTQLARDCRSVYFEATPSTAIGQLRGLSEQLARATGDRGYARRPLIDWGQALDAIADFARDEPSLVVLDEFQFLARQHQGMEGQINVWWRETGRHLPITLVVAGSEVSFFEDEVLAGTMYGRRTGQLKVLPFLAKDAALFHPGYTPEDRIRAFAVCGGIPYYLERFDDSRPLRTHLLQEIISPTGILHSEAELLLRQSITSPENHFAVLGAIAHGYNRNSTIADRTGLAPAQVLKTLRVLERLGLVEQLRPMTAPARSKKTAYRIADQFLRFHCRFIESDRSLTRTAELAESYLAGSVLPKFDHFVSEAWEEVCQEYVLLNAPEVAKVGRWWGNVPTGRERRVEMREIDVVGIDHDQRATAIGMCKWTSTEVDFDELNLLDRLIPHIERTVEHPMRYLFSRSGFSERLQRHAVDDPYLTLIEPIDIYR
ncbi:ATP-binding protein [Glycomyces arizonensis]|uniref:ATP-binding protein n=1 Tax=Glycomyces arizonensis TaxID=256035 RepID=UPI0004211BEF|nr:ATP-binding protein [Glycomyces arizonensis]